jgi:peptidyl-tRNA hydrolase
LKYPNFPKIEYAHTHHSILIQTKLKQVIVVNESLKLPRGKLAAQVAHASVAAFLKADEQPRKEWLAAGMPKVVLQGDGEPELMKLGKAAQERDIPAYIVKDAGRTVIPVGTVTCLGLGPAEAETLDALTGELKLLK